MKSPAVRTAVVVLALMCPALLYANSITSLDISPPDGFKEAPAVRVYSRTGEKWDAVDKTVASRFQVRIHARCRFEGKGNKAYEGDLQVSGFDIIGDTDPADFLIPHSSTAEATFRFNDGSGQPTNVIEVCNTELGKRLSEDADLTKYHVLAKGLTVNYPGAFEVKYRMYCHATGLGKSDLGSDTTLVNARIECAPSELAAARIPSATQPVKAIPARLAPLIESASFEASPGEHKGACPVGIKFAGRMTTGRKGTVRYRYISHDGRESPVFTLVFDKAGTRRTRAWSRTLSKPDPGARLAMPGQGTGDWDYAGWYRMEIIEPAGSEGAQAEYKVKCETPAPSRMIKVD